MNKNQLQSKKILLTNKNFFVFILKIICFCACFFPSINSLAKSEKFMIPNEKEQQKICSDVREEKYEEVPMMTIQEARLNIEKLKEAEKNIYEWHPNYEDKIVVKADYDNDGKEDILILGQYSRDLPKRPCGQFFFMIYNEMSNQLTFLPDSPTNMPMSCDMGGQRIIKYADIFLFKNTVFDPYFWNMVIESDYYKVKEQDDYKKNMSKLDNLTIIYWYRPTYSNSNKKETSDILGSNTFCRKNGK